MNTYKIELTEDQKNALIILIDSANKSRGLEVAKAAVLLVEIIEAGLVVPEVVTQESQEVKTTV